MRRQRASHSPDRSSAQERKSEVAAAAAPLDGDRAMAAKTRKSNRFNPKVRMSNTFYLNWNLVKQACGFRRYAESATRKRRKGERESSQVQINCSTDDPPVSIW
jgi:hypothetical protein